MRNLLSRVRQGRSNETSIFDVMYQTGFAGFDFLNGFEVTGYHKDKTKYTYFATGILDGSFNQIIGRSGSGKTTWAIQVAANIIRPFENGFMLVRSIEGGITIPRMETLTGFSQQELFDRVDIANFGVTTESVFDDVHAIYEEKKENSKDYTYDTGLVDSLGQPIIKYVPTVYVLDSIAMLVPERVSDRDDLGGQMDATALAKSNTQLIKRIIQLMKEVNIIFLGINHITQSVEINPMMHSQAQNAYLKQSESIPGGKAMMYLANNIIRFNDKKIKSETFGFNGMETDISLVKSRSNRSQEDYIPLLLDFTNGFNPIISNMLFLKQVGRITARGAYMQIDDHSDMKFTNKKFLEKYFSNEEFREIFDRVCLEALQGLLPKRQDEAKLNNQKLLNKAMNDFARMCSTVIEE